MQVAITTSSLPPPRWNATGTDRVLQNISNLLSLCRYEVAYNRTLGLSPDLVDRPTTKLIGQYLSEVTELIEDNEPRATVLSVKFLNILENGQMNFEVVVEIDG